MSTLRQVPGTHASGHALSPEPDRVGDAATARRAIRRRLAPLVPLLLGVSLLTQFWCSGQSGAKGGGSPQLLSAADTTELLAGDYPQEAPGSGPTIYDLEFEADTILGQRYLIEVVNGSPAVSSIKVYADSQQWMGSSESGIRVIEVGTTGSHYLSVWVTGSSGSTVSLRVVRVREPTYTIYGPQTFVKPSPPATQTVYFTRAETAKSPYTMRVINGSPSGSNRVTTGTVKINGSQVLSSSDFGTGIASVTRDISLLTQDTLLINNQSASGTLLKIRITATDSTAPGIALAEPLGDTIYTEALQALFRGTTSDETPGWLGLNTRPLIATPGAFRDSIATTTDGRYPVTIQATNSAKLTTTLSRLVIRDTRNPTLTVNATPTETDSSTITLSGSFSDSTRTALSVDGDRLVTTAGINIAFSTYYDLDLGPNKLVFRAIDTLGHKTEVLRYVFRNSAGEAAARDSTAANQTAPPLAATVNTTFLDGVKFLYQESPLIQTSVMADSIREEQASVVHGQVTSRDFPALKNVKVDILGHPEYGRTLSAEDGRFDLVVNGGEQLIVRFRKDGYLESQRPVFPAANEYANLDSVALIGRSARRSILSFTSGSVARGRFKTDANGDRDVRVYFRPGTVAKVVSGPGDTATFSAGVRVRATEFTVGADGKNAMPSLLPPGSAYTFCVDLGLDEADSIHVVRLLSDSTLAEPEILFTDRVSVYVRNFLHLAVGTSVPSGSYDTKDGVWKADSSGYIIRVLTNNGSTVTIDSDGNGLADSQGRLDSLRVGSDELSALAQQYAPDDTLWRMTIRHFSAQDYNYNLAAIAAQQSPGAGRAGQPQGIIRDPTECNGCMIEVENRVLGERIPIVGTAYSLNYRSHRAPGDSAVRTLHIPVSLDTIPSGLERIIVLADIAGQRIKREFAAQTNLIATIRWNGRDRFNRVVAGAVSAAVSIGYQYRVGYAASDEGYGFGDPAKSDTSLGWAGGNRTVGRIAWTKQRFSIGAPSAASDGLGGWTISPHHFYDLTGRGAVYFGDGRVRFGERNYPMLTKPLPSISGNDLKFGPDGAIYVAGPLAIYKSSGVGWIRIAGQGAAGTYVDGQLATSAYLTTVRQLAFGLDGTLYFTMSASSNNAVRACHLAKDGRIYSIAGDGIHHTASWPGDGGPATGAGFGRLHSIAIGPDGSIFLGDTECDKVRRVAPNGIITTYAGTGLGGGGNSLTGLATSIRLLSPEGMCTDADGNLYIAETSNHAIRKVAPDGMMTILFQLPGNAYFLPRDIAFGPDGALYVAVGVSNDNPINYIYRLDRDGAFRAIAGGGPPGAGDNNIPALGSGFAHPQGIDVAQDGAIYFCTTTGYVQKVSSEFSSLSGDELMVPSDDGAEKFIFNLKGQHLRTVDALTGAVRFSFNYDSGQRLSVIYDVNGDSTRIVRSGGGVPLEILGPYGHRTALTLDGNGFLSKVRRPGGASDNIDADTGGLLEGLTDAEGRETSFDFDNDGRLSTDTDAVSATQTIAPGLQGSTRVVTHESGEGRLRTTTVTNLADGTLQRRIVAPDGNRTVFSDSSTARVFVLDPSGLTRTDSMAQDPRFGMKAPHVARRTLRLPSGIARTIETTRSVSAGFDPPSTPGSFTKTVSENGRAGNAAQFTSSTRTLAATSSAGRTVTTAFNAAGFPTSIAIPGLATRSMEYDARGRLTLVADGGRGWRYDYDALGRLRSVRDTLPRTMSFSYDSAGRVVQQTFPGNRTIGFTYDDVDNLVSLTPAGGAAHECDYSDIDLLSRYRPPVMSLTESLTRYVYNDDRQLARVERPDSANITYSYDATNGRLLSVAQPRGSSFLFYTAAGLLDSLTAPDGVTLHYAYDGPLDTMQAWTGNVTGSVGRGFDRDLRPSSRRVNGSGRIDLGYDVDGLLTSIGGLSMSRRSDNGLRTGTSFGALTTTESRNNHGELWKAEATYNAAVLYRAIYARDSMGLVVSVDETVAGTNQVTNYTYSDSGYLAAVAIDGSTVARYAYDANGNRVRYDAPGDSASGNYDAQDRLLRYRNTAYSYGAAGELSTAIAGSDTTRYTYDPLGQLCRVITPAHDTLEYLADGRGRRVARKVNGTVTHKWLYEDQLRIAAELSSGNAIVSRFAYGERPNVPEYMIRDAHTYRLILDHLGSVRMVVDSADGSVAQRMSYDAWGNVLEDTNPRFQPFGFAGGLYDSVTGLVRFGRRDYQASTGRWLARDPFGLNELGAGTYAYVLNAPSNSVDPWGTKSIIDGFPYYGKYGGKGYSGGKKQDELHNNAYLPGQAGFEWPLDARDECYRQHDRNLRECARIRNERDRQRCRGEADVDLVFCQMTIGDRMGFCNSTFHAPDWEFWLFGIGQPSGTRAGEYVP